MKKFTLGLIVGLILATAVPTFADNLIAVTAEFNIVVNGEAKQLDMSPVLINGSSYLPLRATADLLGYSVAYNGVNRTISMNSKQQEVTEPGPTDVISTPTESYRVLDMNEPYTIGDFTITLKRIEKMTLVGGGIRYQYIFDYENSSADRISNYNAISVYDVDGQRTVLGGLLRDYPGDSNITFDYYPNSRGQRFFQIVMHMELEYLQLSGTNVRWKVEY